MYITDEALTYMDRTAFTLQTHHTRLSPRKHSPDGATMASMVATI